MLLYLTKDHKILYIYHIGLLAYHNMSLKKSAGSNRSSIQRFKQVALNMVLFAFGVIIHYSLQKAFGECELWLDGLTPW